MRLSTYQTALVYFSIFLSLKLISFTEPRKLREIRLFNDNVVKIFWQVYAQIFTNFMRSTSAEVHFSPLDALQTNDDFARFSFTILRLSTRLCSCDTITYLWVIKTSRRVISFVTDYPPRKLLISLLILTSRAFIFFRMNLVGLYLRCT